MFHSKGGVKYQLHRLTSAVCKILIAVFTSILLLGCDYHSDSVFLGRKEAELLGHVHSGDIGAVKKFLDQGGNVNLQDEPGMTPLHHAVNDDWKGSHYKMVKLLINRGVNVKAIDDCPSHSIALGE